MKRLPSSSSASTWLFSSGSSGRGTGSGLAVMASVLLPEAVGRGNSLGGGVPSSAVLNEFTDDDMLLCWACRDPIALGPVALLLCLGREFIFDILCLLSSTSQ